MRAFATAAIIATVALALAFPAASAAEETIPIGDSVSVEVTRASDPPSDEGASLLVPAAISAFAVAAGAVMYAVKRNRKGGRKRK